MAADTYGSAALQSLNRILQYQQARERSEVQEALQLMQFAQQKKQFDMQSAAKNLELLSSTNTQFKLKTAQRFSQDTGMSNVYMRFKDDGANAMTNALKYLTETWGAGEQLFEDTNDPLNKDVAAELVSATWELYESKNPDSIMNIGSRLSPDKEMTADNKQLFEAFTKLGYWDTTEGATNEEAITTFQAMSNALENDMNIMMETQEYVKGDYEIQKDFTFVQGALDAFEKEAGDLEKTTSAVSGETQVESPYSPDAQVQQSYDLIQSKNEEIFENKQKLKQLSQNISEAKVLKEQGLEIPEDWELQLQNQTAVENAINTKIQLLSEDVRKLTSTNQNLRENLLTSQIRRGEHGPTGVGKILEASAFMYNDPFQKAAIWNDTGIWPTDEDLEAWEKARGTLGLKTTFEDTPLYK